MKLIIPTLLAAAWLCLPARADAGAEALRHALSLARDGDTRAAARALPDPETLDPPHVPLIGRVANALRDSEPDAAARLYVAMHRLDPALPAPRVALERLFSERPLPPLLYPDDLPFVPLYASLVDLPAGAGAPAAQLAEVSPKPFVAIPASREPRSGVSYPRVAGAYVRRGGAFTLRFKVHYTEAEMGARAGAVGTWLAALSLMSDAMLGPASRARYPVSVWLTSEGAPTAEQWNGAIYIRGARAEPARPGSSEGSGRSELEWARQLAHEWGHATIPGGGGFEAPEAWAAGDLGERLFLPALQRAGWVSRLSFGMDVSPYVKRYVEPLRLRFARTGPVAALVNGTDRSAYDHYLAAALYIEAAYGMPALAAALNDLDGPRTADLLAAFRRTLAARKEWTVARVPGADGAAFACFPARGRYMLETHGEQRPAPPPQLVRSRDGGWEPLTWRGLLTVRRAPAVPGGSP